MTCDVRNCGNNPRLVKMHPNVSIIVGAAILRVKDAPERRASVATKIVRLMFHINNTPPFVTGVVNVTLFLKLQKEDTGGNGSAKMQGDKLVLVPNKAECFRVTVRMLRSIDTSKGVAFHNYRLPEQDVREELEILEIPVQLVLQLHYQHRDPDPAKDRFLTPHFIVTVARGAPCQQGAQFEVSLWPQSDC